MPVDLTIQSTQLSSSLGAWESLEEEHEEVLSSSLSSESSLQLEEESESTTTLLLRRFTRAILRSIRRWAVRRMLSRLCVIVHVPLAYSTQGVTQNSKSFNLSLKG